MAKVRYRPDIDGLRAFAVLAVIAFHAFPWRVPGGYIGVDVFFVISGYLITGICLAELRTETFSLANFYARRVRRIFPALALMLGVVLAAAPLLLLPLELAQLHRHVLAATVFASNVLLTNEAGYFDAESELKPLLHLWSLAIEEQFYLIWPLLLLGLSRFGPRGCWVLLAVSALSFAANLIALGPAPVATFFMPFTRAWELAAGALLAVYHQRHEPHEPSARLTRSLLGLAGCAGLLLCLFLFDAQSPYPGSRALLPVLGTLALLASGPKGAPNRVLTWPWLTYLGRVSYPLYLWHWPALSFLHLVTFGRASSSLKLLVLALSLAAAIATHEWLEKRVQRVATLGRAALGSAAALASCGLVAVVLHSRDASSDAQASGAGATWQQLVWNHWTTDDCLQRYPYPHPAAWWFCASNSKRPPSLLLWGDSHANQLFPGLVSQPELQGHSVLSIGTCQPLDGVVGTATNLRENPCAGQQWPEQAEFVRRIVERERALRFVLLAADWPSFDASGQQLQPTSDAPKAPDFAPADNTAAEASAPSDVFFAGLERRIEFLKARGLTVVLVLGTPKLLFDVRDCLERPLVTPRSDCNVSYPEQLHRQQLLRSRARTLAAEHPRLRVFDPLPALCNAASCPMLSEGRVWFRDGNHLSEAGSARVAAAFVRWAKRELPQVLRPSN